MSNINDSFFDGYYKELWRSLIPDELTVKEVDFMLSYFNLKQGSKVFDLMCGYGRHALALGRKGMEVTAVDNLPDYIQEIKETVKKENLPVKIIQQGILDYVPAGPFDLAICMGNSLNFFEAGDVMKLFSNISAALRPGGHLLINTWSIAEIAIKNFKEKSWSTIGDAKFLTDSKFHFHPSRIETESIIVTKEGKTEVKTGIDYIYSINEIGDMLQKAGLRFKEIYSIPGKKKFTIGEPRAYIIAEKG